MMPMEKGESLPDYLLFGDVFETGESEPGNNPGIGGLVADLFEIPLRGDAGKNLTM